MDKLRHKIWKSQRHVYGGQPVQEPEGLSLKERVALKMKHIEY